MYKTAVYTRFNGYMLKVRHLKQQKSWTVKLFLSSTSPVSTCLLICCF